MADIVLVHACWQGAWCWDDLTDELIRSGHGVYRFDLPGHGQDTTPPERVTFDTYVQALAGAVNRVESKPIIVGHSMAGLIMTQLAEVMPDCIGALAYVAASLPENGMCLMDLVGDADPEWIGQFRWAPDGLTVSLAPEAPGRFLYPLSARSKAEWAARQLRPEPVAPTRSVVRTTEERSGQVPRYYVECLQDRVVPIALQRRMYTAVPCRGIFTLDSDHSPFLSMPRELAACLDRIAGSQT